MNRAEKRRQQKMAAKAAKGSKAAGAANPAEPALVQSINNALQHHAAGRLPEAEQIYQQILQADPNQVDALHLLGVLAHQIGKNEAAVELISKAITIKPDFAEAHCNLASALQAMGRSEEAAANCRKALAIKPGYADAHYNLGNALQALGDLEEAARSYQKVLSLKPDHADAHGNLGNALKEQGKLEEAVTSYRNSLAIRPNFAEMQSNLGNALKELGDLDGAVESYQKALSIKPGYAEAHFNLATVLLLKGLRADGVAHYREAVGSNPRYTEAHNHLASLLLEDGDLDGAARHCRIVIELEPDHAEAHYNLGVSLMKSGQILEAFGHFRKSIKEKSSIALYWTGYAQCFEGISFSSFDEQQSRELLTMLAQPPVIPKRAAKPIMTFLHHHPALVRLENQFRSHADVEDIAATVENLSQLPLLLKLMELTTINDAGLERILTQVRRAMLLDAIKGHGRSALRPFDCALSLHCFGNGFLFFETNEEKQQIIELQGRLEGLVKNEDEVPAVLVAVYSCYRSLHQSPFDEFLLVREWPDDLDRILDRQLREPREEEDLRAQISSAEPIYNEVSRSVRMQYEENPYPVWVKPVSYPEAKTVELVLQDIPLDPRQIEGELPESPNILIAGCGTGQQPTLSASRYRNAQIFAVDLSLSSLSYALRKTRELGVSNIDYMQCDIYDLGKLEKSFDIIECRGVLHHLGDPIAGWKVLVEILRPKGLMKIGLYSKIARQGVRKSRDLIGEKGYAAIPDGIRSFRRYVMDNPDGLDPDIYELINSPDFYSINECRDLVFHAQETQYSLLEIDAALNDLGLRFLGFELPDFSTLTRFRQLNPEGKAAQSLPEWHRFEEKYPKEFGQMYEFWVQKK